MLIWLSVSVIPENRWTISDKSIFDSSWNSFASIIFTDKTSVNYGKIINKETLQLFGWVDPNDDEQYVEEQPDYVEEEENDEDVIDCDWDF